MIFLYEKMIFFYYKIVLLYEKIVLWIIRLLQHKHIPDFSCQKFML